MTRLHPLIRELADDDRAFDPFGSALSVHFSICDVLMAVDPDAIPAAWQFRPGAAAPHTLTELAELADDLQVPYASGVIAHAVRYTRGETPGEYGPGMPPLTVADLVYAGNVLHRYVHLCELHGKDY